MARWAERIELHQLAVKAKVRRRVAPHQLRHAHAVELLHEGIALPLIQRQLYLQRIDTEEAAVSGTSVALIEAAASSCCASAAGSPGW